MSIVRRSVSEIRKKGRGRVDWKRVRATTEREIVAQTASDPDTAPDLSQLKKMRRVYHPPVPDVKAIRDSLGLTQSEFAGRFGFSVRTLQQWEQGRAIPDRPSRILLRVIQKAPQAVDDALSVQE